MPEINTHGMRVPFGRHKGELVTRVPVTYLEWLINVGSNFAPVAEAELKRRGHVPREIDITAHAIDRASLRIMGVFLADHKPNEGFHSWLARVAIEALAVVKYEEMPEKFRIELSDMKLVYTKGNLYPTLVTVMKPGYEKQD